jgi:hypothetical protein
MNKKTLIIIGIVAGLIIVGFGIFFLVKQPETGQPADEGFMSFLFPTAEDKPILFPPAQEDDFPPEEGDAITRPETKDSLVQLTAVPVSRAVFNEKSQKVRYFEKSNGHLYEISPDGSEKKQISITTIPKIFEVFWSKDSSKAVLRYFDLENSSGPETVRTFVVSSLATSTEGTFLPTSAYAVAVSPKEDKIFYLLNNAVARGIITSFDPPSGLKKQEEIFSLPFGEFLTTWPQKNMITLLTKPSATAEGYLYKLNPRTWSFTKIFGNIKGLTTLHSPNNSKIIYSQSKNKTMETKIYNSDKQKSTPLGIITLPEKCLFSKIDENMLYCAVPKNIPAADYPDDWYKGIISFTDSLWQIDLDDGSAKIILDKGNFDIINLSSNKEENYLFFQNKKDSALWSLRLGK